jgi:hypothetical protein
MASAAMQTALVRQLQDFVVDPVIYPNGYTPPAIPAPLFTHIEHLPWAWHFEWPGATVSVFDKQVYAAYLKYWSPEFIGSNVYIVGEAYNPQRAWIAAPLTSIMLSFQFMDAGDVVGPRAPLVTQQMLGSTIPPFQTMKQRVACMCMNPGFGLKPCTKCNALSPKVTCDELAARRHFEKFNVPAVAFGVLMKGQTVQNHDGTLFVEHKEDGNVELRQGTQVLWQTGTAGKLTTVLRAHGSGHVCLHGEEETKYNETKSLCDHTLHKKLWSSHANLLTATEDLSAQHGNLLYLSQGRLILFDKEMNELWRSH